MASFPLLFSTILMILTFMSILKHLQKKRSKLPPGPNKLPFVGNLHQLAGSKMLPHHWFAHLSKTYGNIMLISIGQRPSIVITSSELAEEILKSNDVTFSQRVRSHPTDIMAYGPFGVVTSPYGDYWKQLRKICVSELLSLKRVQSFRSVREEEVWSLMDSISANSGALLNLSEKIVSFTSLISARAAFGTRSKYVAEFLSVIKETEKIGLVLVDQFPSLKWIPAINKNRILMEIHDKIDKVLGDIVNEYKDAKTKKVDDGGGGGGDEHLIDFLLGLMDRKGDSELSFTITDVKAVLLDLYFGGTETTGITIEWVMAELMKNPSVMNKAQAEVRQVLKGKTKIYEEDIQELTYLKLVIKETLRLHPPFALFPRQARENCEIKGYTIPKDIKILINAWAISRDPNVWGEDSECFRPERFEGSSVTYKGTNFEYIPFGSGRRMCPGMFFGIATAELPLTLLLYHFDWKLPEGVNSDQFDMSEALSVFSKRKNNLCLSAIPFTHVDSEQESREGI